WAPNPRTPPGASGEPRRPELRRLLPVGAEGGGDDGEDRPRAELGLPLDQQAPLVGEAGHGEDRELIDAGHRLLESLAVAHRAALDQFVVELEVDGVGAGHGVVRRNHLVGGLAQPLVPPALAVVGEHEAVEDGGGQATVHPLGEAVVEGVLQREGRQRPVAVEGDLELGDPGFREGLRGEKKEAQERKFRSHQGRQSSIGRGFCLSLAGLLPWSTLPIAERRSLSGSDPKTMKRLLYLLCLALLPAQGGSQTATAPKAPSAAPPPSAQVPTRPGEEETMSFEDYDPKSTLVVPQHPKTRAKYPFIDIHNHQDAAHMTPAQVDKLVADMDGLNMSVMNNLSGGWGDELAQGMKN